MFERFRRSRDTGTGATATREPEIDERSARVDDARFDRDSAGERDRGVVAGGGDGAALDREHARDDLARDDVARDDAPARDDAVDRDEDRHHHHGGAIVGGAAAAGAGAAAMHHHDEKVRDREAAAATGDRTRVHDRDGAVGDGIHDRRFDEADHDGVVRHAPVLAPDALDTMRARQRDRFGGIQWGSDFFGWLCAIGLAALLTSALVGAGVALGLSTTDAQTPDGARTIGLGGGIALLVVLAIAWLCGGYVAGRMARFDGARQGVGVWLWTVLAAVVVAAVAAVGGSEYDLFQRLNLPRIAVGNETLTAGGAIAGAAAIIVTLIFAVIGGKVGERFHRRVDRVATDEFVVDR